MRSLPADGGSDPSTSGGSGDPSTSGRRGAAPGRLKRALMALASLRTPLTLRRLLTIAFMFSVGSLLSLASSRGRCAGPQEVRCAVAEGGGRGAACLEVAAACYDAVALQRERPVNHTP